MAAVRPGRWNRECFHSVYFTKGGFGGLIDCMEEFCEVAESKRVFLIGMCILIRARLKFGGCALWRPVAPVNV